MSRATAGAPVLAEPGQERILHPLSLEDVAVYGLRDLAGKSLEFLDVASPERLESLRVRNTRQRKLSLLYFTM